TQKPIVRFGQKKGRTTLSGVDGNLCVLCYLCVLVLFLKESIEVPSENLLPHLRAGADLVQRRGLLLVHVADPPPRKERRVGAEQQAVRTDDGQRLTKDAAQRQSRLVFHPAVRARRVEEHVRT